MGTVKLKGRSIWDTQAYGNDSWCWKTILDLGQMIEDHVRFKVGNGKEISAWYDRWNETQFLAKYISKREVLSAGFNDHSKLCDVIDGNKWKWPTDWSEKHNFLKNLQVPDLRDEPDCLMWVTNHGKLVKYRTS
ncbi:hypothetical protein Tco_1279592, partial [Tanacetum coccineum]